MCVNGAQSAQGQPLQYMHNLTRHTRSIISYLGKKHQAQSHNTYTIYCLSQSHNKYTICSLSQSHNTRTIYSLSHYLFSVTIPQDIHYLFSITISQYIHYLFSITISQYIHYLFSMTSATNVLPPPVGALYTRFLPISSAVVVCRHSICQSYKSTTPASL